MEASAIIKSFCEKVGIGYEPDAHCTCSFKADVLRIMFSDLKV